MQVFANNAATERELERLMQQSDAENELAQQELTESVKLLTQRKHEFY